MESYKQQAVKEALMEYCVPKTDGITAWEIAGLILEALEDATYDGDDPKQDQEQSARESLDGRYK